MRVVILICLVDDVVLKFLGVLNLSPVKHSTGSNDPDRKNSLLTQGCEEAVLLSPNEVLLSAAHSKEADRVSVWERENSHTVVVLQECDSLVELTEAELWACADNAALQLVQLDDAIVD